MPEHENFGNEAVLMKGRNDYITLTSNDRLPSNEWNDNNGIVYRINMNSPISYFGETMNIIARNHSRKFGWATNYSKQLSRETDITADFKANGHSCDVNCPRIISTCSKSTLR